MLPNDRAQPAARDKPSWGARILHYYRQAPTWLKVTLVAAAVILFPATGSFIVVGTLIYAAVAVVQGRRTIGASVLLAAWGAAVFLALNNGGLTKWIYSLLLLPFVVALAAHARPLVRWFVPCRTVAWVLLWSVPISAAALKVLPHQPLVGTIAAWLLAAAVLGWRLAKGIQDARMYGNGLAGSADRPGHHTPAGASAGLRTAGAVSALPGMR